MRTHDALPARLRSKRVIELVENGVDTDLFQPQIKGPESAVFHIIHIGRLVDVKRVDLLLAACKRLVGKVGFQLDLIGDGPMRGKLEKQVELSGLGTYVRFHGRLSQTAAADFLRSADVFVLPSMRECGGAVVLEAMASGIPVVAAKWGGPADYISKDTGILIPPMTPDLFVDELGKAMLLLAANQKLRSKMGAAGRQRALELYDWRRKATAIVKIYQDVLSFAEIKTRALAK